MTYLHVRKNQEAERVFKRLFELIQELGLPINEKVVHPTDVIICMGIQVDAKRKVVSLTQDKLDEIKQTCYDFVGKKRVSRKQLQSLLGKLLYLTKILTPARAFLNRMLWYLRGQQSFFINLGEGFSRDLQWFIRLLSGFCEPPSFHMINDEETLDVFT